VKRTSDLLRDNDRYKPNKSPEEPQNFFIPEKEMKIEAN
jgi:hypothetical protein